MPIHNIYGKTYNFVNILRENYQINLGPDIPSDIVLGLSFDLNNFNNPIVKGVFLTNLNEIANQANFETVSDIQSYDYYVHKSQTIEDEMSRLSLAFSGSYGVVSGDLEYEKIKNYFEQNDVYYLVFESVTGHQNIEDITQSKWKNKPTAEDIQDFDSRFEHFLGDYGSHYLKALTYGSRIVLRASINKQNTSESEKLHLALKAVGMSWGASADISYEHKQQLSSTNVEIKVGILGKLISTTNALKNPVFQITDYAQIYNLFNEIREGETKIVSCPIRGLLETFKYRLTEYPNCEKLFTDLVNSHKASSPYGVPSGTIIAWMPTLNNCRLDDQGNVIEIIPPDGWMICNNNSDYDMTGRFLRGAANWSEITTKIGGTADHGHEVMGRTGGYDRIGKRPAGLDGGGDDWEHSHAIAIPTTRAVHLPPYFNVIHLMKI